MIIAFHDYQYWASRTFAGGFARCDTTPRNKIFLINDCILVFVYQLSQKQPVDEPWACGYTMGYVEFLLRKNWGSRSNEKGNDHRLGHHRVAMGREGPVYLPGISRAATWRELSRCWSQRLRQQSLRSFHHVRIGCVVCSARDHDFRPKLCGHTIVASNPIRHGGMVRVGPHLPHTSKRGRLAWFPFIHIAPGAHHSLYTCRQTAPVGSAQSSPVWAIHTGG